MIDSAGNVGHTGGLLTGRYHLTVTVNQVTSDDSRSMSVAVCATSGISRVPLCVYDKHCRQSVTVTLARLNRDRLVGVEPKYMFVCFII